MAIAQGASIIVETDDDNYPLSKFFEPRERLSRAKCGDARRWQNVYNFFSKSLIWPRGFPLNRIKDPSVISSGFKDIISPIQQGLANQNPDVDAIYRLVCKLPIDFEIGENIHLLKGQYCPFNSQNTTFFKEAFPLLYLPSYCSFRMTDIWRSFIAIRICHQLEWDIMFHAPTVFQDRNHHDLMRDFSEEVSGYLGNEKMVEILEGLNLKEGEGVSTIAENLITCYEAICSSGFIDEREIDHLKLFLDDLQKSSC